MNDYVNVKQVIVMRVDINMRKGKMIAQGAHASSLWFLRQGMLYPNGSFRVLPTGEQRAWMSGPFTKVCVRADSEAHLLELCEQGRAAGLVVHEMWDNGATEFHGVRTLTCAAFGPHESHLLDPVTGGLTLL